MAAKFIIAIDLGGTNLKIALLTPQYRIRDKKILSTRKFRNKQGLIAAIVDAIRNIIENNGLKASYILGIGLGLPGPIDARKGVVHFFPNIPGWKEVGLKTILEKKLKLRVCLDNDVNLMSLAEHKLGAAKNFKNVLCLTLGTGIGGGLILENRLYRGANNATGEIGHLPINEDGPRCNCGGIACLEAYIGNKRIMRQAKKIFRRNISLEELSALAKKGNKQAQNLWAKVGSHLGVALAGAVNLLNLDAIVIGGGVASAGKILFGQVRYTIKERAMSVQAKHVKIFPTKLKSDAGLIGAAILVKEAPPFLG